MGELSQNTNKVCILAAGKGTRMGYNIPKVLLPVDHKAMLSHIMSWFPCDQEFVIAVGWQKKKIIDFVELIHPTKNIEFVHVDNWDGEGSGPGYSLLACEPALSDPFYFIASDCYMVEQNEEFPFPETRITKNVILTSGRFNDTRDYLSVHIAQRTVKDWGDKTGTYIDVFTGIAKIYDTRFFFNGLRGKSEVMDGFKNLPEVHTCPDHTNKWRDIGTREKYLKVLEEVNTFGFLPKDKELLYFYSTETVVKYFDDADCVTDRIYRAKKLGDALPKLAGKSGNFFAYRYVDGQRISHVDTDKELYGDFLAYCEDTIWTPVKLNRREEIDFDRAGMQFYMQKTEQRVADFIAYWRDKDAYWTDDMDEPINGVMVPSVQTLLEHVNWNGIVRYAKPVLFHGDPQPENIIVTPTRQFKFLDWRQGYGEYLKCGDKYYDQAKLYHALIVSGEVIRQGQFEVSSNHFDFHKRFNLDLFRQVFEEYCQDSGSSLKHIQLLTALVYLNLAPLYKDKYGRFLFMLGKYALNDALEGRWTI